MTDMKIGADDVDKIFIGTDVVDKIFSGTDEVFTDTVKAFPSSVCFDLDATQSLSYPGAGQTWSNLIASPADGAAQIDYDFWLGKNITISTDDPNFIGNAGDAAAHWLMDGRDFFSHKDGVGAPNCPALANIAKNTAGIAWWITLVFKTAPTAANGNLYGNAGNNGNIGFRTRMQDSGKDLNPFMFDGTAGISQGAGNDIFLPDTNYLMILTADMFATIDNSRRYLNSITPVESNKTFGINSSVSNGVFRIGVRVNESSLAGDFMPIGSRVYAISGGNSYLTAEEAESIFFLYQDAARHNRSYGV